MTRRGTNQATTALRQCEKLSRVFGPDSEKLKLFLLDVLGRTDLPSSAADVRRLHELLCFMRAYPDDAQVLRVVETMLDGFDRRRDLRRHAGALFNSGIAGTSIHFSFYWATAAWLARRWPDAITIDWPAFSNSDRLDSLWPLLLPDCETMGLEESNLSQREWIEALRGPRETDAAFLIRRFAAWRVDDGARALAFEELDVPLRIAPAPGTPSRTRSKHPPAAIAYQRGTGGRTRRAADFEAALRRCPESVRTVDPREGQRLIDLARVQMITRERDLYAFCNADRNDVRLVAFDDGLQFVCYGLLPRRRLLLESLYVFLILKNGVPVGYTQASSLFRSSEVNFNVFDSFRGTETATIFALTLAMTRHLFGADTFVINTQQLGRGNPEALKTGAFWFYAKHGFRPLDPAARQLMRTERARMKTAPGYRSGIRVLKHLAGGNLYRFLDKPREEVVSTIDTTRIGLACSQLLARQFGSNRERAIRRCTRDAAALLGMDAMNNWSPAQRAMWANWSPLLLSLPGVTRWSDANKRALIEVVKAKGGRSESEYVALFDRHRLLCRAIWKLARSSAG